MAYLWFVEDEHQWAAMPVTERPVDVGADVPRVVAPEHLTVKIKQNGTRKATVIVPTGEGPSRMYALVWGPGQTVRVNGWTLTAGLRVLADKDEIKVGVNTPVFFSTESVAQIEIFPGSDREIFCPRCTLPIEAGKPVVRCPKCHIIHHQDDEELGCWTYGPGCAVCSQPTAMDAGFRWTPEETWG